MNNFVWILNSKAAAFSNSQGVANSFRIPKEHMHISAKSLAGSRLWIVLRDNEDRLFLSLKIKRVEKITASYHKNDFLVFIDLLYSFRIASEYFEAKEFTIASLISHKIGIHKIDKSLVNDFYSLVKANTQIKLITPNKNIFSKINEKMLIGSGKMLAISAMRLTIQQFNLNQIWAQGMGQKLPAYSNFAKSLIEAKKPSTIPDNVINILKKLDPIANAENDNIEIKASTDFAPRIDTAFTEIDPNNIFARKFIAGTQNSKDLESMLNKTEQAEKTHQDMLKDISSFLIDKRIKPLESSSIDLCYWSRQKFKICEIKSATPENIFSQASKGAFQLSCYIDEMAKIYDKSVPLLILKAIGDESIEKYIAKILKQMNIPVVFYYANKQWPDRVSGIL